MADKSTKRLIENLVQIVGKAHVLTDTAYYSEDVYSYATPPLAVVQAGDKHDLALAVQAVTEAGIAVLPRGGGMSYTSGYLSNRQAVLFDMTRMGRVLEVNAQDMYVRVEAGCSWIELHRVLSQTSYITPMWGALSGISSTVGGAMSQNAAFFGSTQHGTAADSVIGMEIVCADGRILTTGSASRANATPFLRHFGPDLNGIFTGDAGMFGIKAEIVLRLIARPSMRRHISFDFEDYQSYLTAMSEIARRGLASECFGFDPFLQAQRARRESLAQDIATMGKVARKSLKDALSIALVGRRFMKGLHYSMHSTTAHDSAAAATHAIREIGKISRAAGGRKIANSIPKLIHAHPFTPLNNMIGPNGERWVPVHGLVPHSKAEAVLDALTDYFAKAASEIKTHKIGIGYLISAVGSGMLIVEPVFFWQDALMSFHHKHVEPHVLQNIENFPENLDARAAVDKLRQGVIDIFAKYGTSHFQLGRSYPYAETIAEPNAALIKELKRALDPHMLMNPGVLGIKAE